MPKAQPAAGGQTTIPLPDSTDVSQAVPSNLGRSSTSVPEVKLDAEARSLSDGAAEMPLGPESMPADKAEEHRVPAFGLSGSGSAPANQGQPAEADHGAKQPVEVQSAAGGHASLGKGFPAKRLKGGAAVLAKVLGLNMLATAQPAARTGTPALQSGQSSKALLDRLWMGVCWGLCLCASALSVCCMLVLFLPLPAAGSH